MGSTELRFEPNGHRVRTFRTVPDGKATFMTRSASGRASMKTAGQLVEAWGALEVALVVPNRERFRYALTQAAATRQLDAWRARCRKDGLVATRMVQYGR